MSQTSGHDSGNSAAAQVPPQLALRQLDTILSSEAFKNSSRLSRFLRYVVEQSLQGDAPLKERQIGVDVFDRSSDYDPRADPVVRVEARQLRFKLVEYYAKTGLSDEILISLPKGGYSARFERCAAPVAASSRDTAQQNPTSEARGKWTILLTALAVVALLLVLAYAAVRKPAFQGIAARSTNHLTAQEVNPQARDLYLKGRYYWNQRTPEALTQAVDSFTQAIVRDPGYAQAYVGLADCYNLLSEFSSTPAREAFTRAHAAAQKAVELDESSAEAHNALAFASFWGMWDVATADREFRRALALNPKYAQARHWYATYLMALGRVPESLVEIERAQELDPLSTSVLADKGLILFHADRKEEAITLLKQLEATQPAFLSSHRYLRDIALISKDYRTYVLEARQTASLSHDAAALAIADAAEKGLGAGGGQAVLQSVLSAEKRLYAQGLIQAYSLAQTCALMGEKHAALGYLRRAFEQHESGMLALRIDFLLCGLQEDAEYNDLLKKVGFPESS